MLACVDSKFTPIFQKKKEQYTPVLILNAEKPQNAFKREEEEEESI